MEVEVRRKWKRDGSGSVMQVAVDDPIGPPYAAFTYTQTLMSIHGSTADKRRSDGAPTYFPLSGMPFPATIENNTYAPLEKKSI